MVCYEMVAVINNKWWMMMGWGSGVALEEGRSTFWIRSVGDKQKKKNMIFLLFPVCPCESG